MSKSSSKSYEQPEEDLLHEVRQQVTSRFFCESKAALGTDAGVIRGAERRSSEQIGPGGTTCYPAGCARRAAMGFEPAQGQPSMGVGSGSKFKAVQSRFGSPSRRG